MGHKRQYLWRVKEGETTANTGFEPADILLQHYGDPGMRTMVMREEDFKRIKPWELCSMLNEAYESGRKDSMEDLRRFIGVEK